VTVDEEIPDKDDYSQSYQDIGEGSPAKAGRVTRRVPIVYRHALRRSVTQRNQAETNDKGKRRSNERDTLHRANSLEIACIQPVSGQYGDQGNSAKARKPGAELSLCNHRKKV
jgi:hypothetical protein